MFELIKQVLKSFRKSILLLFGLVFIAFAIIFASTSSLYFSSNVSNSYTTLNNNSNQEDAILEVGEDQLNNKNLLNNIYDTDINFGSLEQNKPINSVTDLGDILLPDKNTGLYFKDINDYNNYQQSFIYQPAILSKFMFQGKPGYTSYIFPYYVKTTNGEKNPYFEAPNIDDPNHLYSLRANGILKSYGSTPIPSNSQYWRAEAISLRDNSNPTKILYSIDPLTGITKKDENGLVQSYGFFSDGIYEDKIRVIGGNKIYPKNVVEVSDLNSVANDNQNYNMTIDGKTSPFFVSKQNWSPTFDFDLSQYGGLDKILQLIKDGYDAFNIMSSITVNTFNSLPLGKFNWNIVQSSSLYDYIKIFHDKRYISDAQTISIPNLSRQTQDSVDFIFNISVDRSRLNKLQNETMDFVKSKYPNEYADLSRFIFSFNVSWVKESIKTIYSNYENVNQFDSINFNNPLELQKEITLKNKTTNEEVTVSGKSVIIEWIEKNANKKQKEFQEKIKQYEKEYLASILNDTNDVNFNLQKSFTITDSESSRDILVSLKDSSDIEHANAKINDLYVTNGTKLFDSTKYLDVIDYLFNPTIINKNENGKIVQKKYLLNFVNLISNSEIVGIPKTDKNYANVKKLSSTIIDEYKNFNFVDDNYYRQLMAIINFDVENYTNKLVNTNNQNISIKIIVNGGLTSARFEGSLEYATPYGHAAIVTSKWTKDNVKQIISRSEWEKALKMSSEDFFEWKKALPDKNTISINSRKFILIGEGQSSENAFPIVSLEKPIPNSYNEALVFVNNQGYESILSTAPASAQNIYFAIKFKNQNINSNQNLSEINSSINGLLTKNAYLANDVDNNKNLLTLRISYPKIINNYVTIFATIVIVLLIIIGIYLCYLMIKMYVDKNQTSLAIIKANGMPHWKIVLALSVFGMFVAIISGFLGYIAAFYMQYIFLGIVGNYWFIPIFSHEFSAINFFGGSILIYLCFTFFVFIGVFFLFKQPLNSLISKNTDIKINRLLYIFKATKIKLPTIPKFTISLIVNKIGKFVLLTTLASFALSIISIGVSNPNKFLDSRTMTQQNRSYDYNFELITPTEQSGLYKLQDYVDIGTTNYNLGVGNIFDGVAFNRYSSLTYQPYTLLWMETDLTKENNRDLLALRNLDGTVKTFGENKTKKYFTNFILPSYTDYSLVKNDINYFRNAVFTKWLLDFDISVASLNINAWDIVKQTLSSEIVARIELISQEFIRNFLSVDEIAKVNAIGSGTIQNPKPFITKESDNTYRVISDNVITQLDLNNLNSIRLNNSFLKFIGMVYGDERLSVLDTKLNYGIIPNNDDIETYTYIDASIENKNKRIPFWFNNGKNRLVGVNEKIYGVKRNSKYVSLKNSRAEDISYLLYQTPKPGQDWYPLIVNNGAALKYGFNVGDEFQVTAHNTYDRYSKKMYGDTTEEIYKFKIVGISSDSFSTAFYTSQEIANKILKMDFESGALIISDFTRNKNPTDPNNPSNFVIDAIGYKDKIYSSDKFKVNVNEDAINGELKDINYQPFNGVFSDEAKPQLLSNIAIQSVSGIWANFSNFNSDQFNALLWYSENFYIFDLITPYAKDRVEKYKEYLIKNGYQDYSWTNNLREDIIDIYLRKYPNDSQSIPNYLESIFPRQPISISLQYLDFFKTVFDTYNTIFWSFIIIQNLLISIFVPIIIMIIMIVSSALINDFRKMLAILKTLGYSDRHSLMILYITFIPVFLVSLIIGLAIFSVLIFAIQTSIFNLASIYLTSTIDLIPFMYGIASILAILVINFIYVAIYMKKQNLKNSIA